METAFLRTVSDHTIFNRDSYEAICHDVLLDKLPDIGCILHRTNCIVDVIEDYLLIRFTCLERQEKLLRTEKVSLESQTKRKQAKVIK